MVSSPPFPTLHLQAGSGQQHHDAQAVPTGAPHRQPSTGAQASCRHGHLAPGCPHSEDVEPCLSVCGDAGGWLVKVTGPWHGLPLQGKDQPPSSAPCLWLTQAPRASRTPSSVPLCAQGAASFQPLALLPPGSSRTGALEMLNLQLPFIFMVICGAIICARTEGF